MAKQKPKLFSMKLKTSDNKDASIEGKSSKDPYEIANEHDQRMESAAKGYDKMYKQKENEGMSSFYKQLKGETQTTDDSTLSKKLDESNKIAEKSRKMRLLKFK